MSISSVSAPSPVQPPTTSQTTMPPASNDSDSDDAGAAQPPAQAPLPPGQGTRIDQLA
jgi:hypothetical protein